MESLFRNQNLGLGNYYKSYQVQMNRKQGDNLKNNKKKPNPLSKTQAHEVSFQP